MPPRPRRPDGELDEAVRLRRDAVWSAAGEELETAFIERRWAEVLNGLEAAAACEPDSGWAYALRAEVLRLPQWGRYEEALEDLERALRASPGRFWILGLQGRALAQAGRGREAAAALDAALALEPQCAWILGERAGLRLSLGDKAGALADARAAAALDPDWDAGRRGLARVLTACGLLEEVIKISEDIDAPDPEYARLRFEALRGLGRWPQAAEALRACALAGGAHAWLALSRQAGPALAEALEEIAQAGCSERDPWLYLWQGEAKLRLGRREEAEADLTRAVDLDSRLAWPWLERGRCRIRGGRSDKALADLGRALKLAPPGARGLVLEAHLLRGEAWFWLGEAKKAAASCSQALELDPACARAWLGRAEARMKLGENDAAAEDLRLALGLDAQYGEAFLLRGRLHAAAGRWPAAFADLDRAVELRPHWALPWLHRALAHGQEGDFAAQIADFKSALLAQPDFFHAALPKLKGRAAQALKDRELQAMIEGILLRPN